jgi:hypothetical protein
MAYDIKNNSSKSKTLGGPAVTAESIIWIVGAIALSIAWVWVKSKEDD